MLAAAIVTSRKVGVEIKTGHYAKTGACESDDKVVIMNEKKYVHT